MSAARFDQCDATCTVDCGHCKGAGPPRGITKLAADLAPGDVHLRPSYSTDPPIRCTVLGVPEPHADPFGRPVVRLMARREDTGAQGFLVFGPDATVEVEAS